MLKSSFPINCTRWAPAILIVWASACGCNSQVPVAKPDDSRSELDAHSVGFVLDVSGDWVCEGSQQPLTAGDSLPVGVSVAPRNGDRSECKLVVALCTGETKTFDNQAVELPARIESNRWSRIWSLAKSRYGRSLISAQARGDAESKMQDAVVTLEDVKLDLQRVFEPMPAGSYRIQREVDGELTDLGVHEWQPGRGESLIVDGLKPGIHYLNVSANESANRLASGGAMILVASRSEFERLAEDYRLAVELTRTWSDSVPRTSVRQFLRAILVALADEGSSSQ